MYKIFLKAVIKIRLFLRMDVNDLRIKLYRRSGYNIGEDCRIFTVLNAAEPYLVEIGDGVTISTGVTFITHDNSIIKVTNGEYTDLFGKIKIGKNVFVGSGVILLPGIEICDNTIVAAGSVVASDVKKEGLIIGGNPARIIGSWDVFTKKNRQMAFDCRGKTRAERKKMILENQNKLLKKQEIRGEKKK